MTCALVSCSSGKGGAPDGARPSDAKQPALTALGISPTGKPGSQYVLQVVPEQVDRNGVLSAIPHGFSTTDGPIEWLVNGSRVAEGYAFRPASCSRGDSIQGRAMVNGREVLSNVIQVGNTPPEVTSVTLLPEVLKSGDKLYADVETKDPDGDEVSVQYEWKKNGEPAGNGKFLEADIKRGDRISLKITPSDKESAGQSFERMLEIRNFPPEITEGGRHTFDGAHFTYQVKASDPDGDPLTYALKEGPKGMTIDPAKGLVSWDVPAEFVGRTTFTVTADDGHGGVASYTGQVTIKSE